MQREDVEDQRGAINDLHPEPLLEVAKLPGRELVVEDHGVRAIGVQFVVDLTDLAFADERGGIGVAPVLHDAGDGRRTRRLGERGELVEVRLLVAPTDADEHSFLPDRRAPRRGERRLGHRSVGSSGAGTLHANRKETPG